MRAVGRILDNMRNHKNILTCIWVRMPWMARWHVLRIPPHGYSPFFATLNLQSTCRGPRPGPTLAPWSSGGLPACPGAESTSKDPRPEEQKNTDVQKKHTFIHIVMYSPETGQPLLPRCRRSRIPTSSTSRQAWRRLLMTMTMATFGCR